MNIIFAGTPIFAVPTLRALINSDHEVLSVYTQPDRPAGRGQKMQTSPVKQLAIESQLPVYQPINFNNAAEIESLRQQQPDMLVVIAYGLILPKAVLSIPRHGCLNVHASLLPRWRGAAPIQRAILAGDRQTGVTIMQMDEGLDTGAMLRVVTTDIHDDETGQSLHDRLATLGADALLEVVNAISEGHAPEAVVQDDNLATYAHKLSKTEAEIDWTLEAVQIDRKIRAFNPWPVAYTSIADQSLRVWQAMAETGRDGAEPGVIVSLDDNELHVATGTGQIVLQEVQPAGKRRMPIDDYINSRRESLRPGTRLGL